MNLRKNYRNPLSGIQVRYQEDNKYIGKVEVNLVLQFTIPVYI